MTYRGGSKPLSFLIRKRCKNIYRGESFDDILARCTFLSSDRATLHMQRACRKCELNSGTFKGVPDTLTNQGVAIVILRIVLQPVLHFPINTAVSECSDSHNRRDLWCYVLRIPNGLSNDMNCLRGRIRIKRVEKYQPGVQVI